MAMTDARTPSEARPGRMDPLARLPVFLALEGKRAVLAGGSAAAAWKAELLAAAGARVEVYALETSESCFRSRRIRRAEQWRSIAAAGRLTILKAPRSPSARSIDDADAGCICRGGARRGVPVNVIDKPAFCDFCLRRHRQPLAAGDRHFDRRRRAGVCASDPRQARGAVAEGLCATGPRRRHAGVGA